MSPWLALLLAVGGLPPTATPAHPNSISRSRITVRGDQARVELDFQTLTLIEELAVDDDGNLMLEADELERHRARIAEYLTTGFVLRSGGPDGPQLAGELHTLELAQDPSLAGAFPMMGQWLSCELTFSADAPLRGLVLEWRLFEVMNPEHLDYATLLWEDEDPQTWVFGLGTLRWEHETWAERRPRVIRAFFRRPFGTAAILPLCLLAALLSAARHGSGRSSAVLALAAFALGLALAAPDLAAPPRAFCDLAAALSVAYVATDTLIRRSPRAPQLEALAFGAVHGLAAGWSVTLDATSDPQTSAALLGVALGWSVLLIPAAALGLVLLGHLPGDRTHAAEAEPSPAATWLAARLPRLALSGAAALVGFAFFASRSGFLDLGG